jgi:hypothetical protein
MTTNGRHASPRGWRGRARLAACAALLLAGAACDGLFDVDTPDRVPAGEAETPGNASLLVAGAIADFECAFGAYTVAGGLIGEELIDATQTANRWPYDQRTLTPADTRYATELCQNLGVYTPLNSARAQADNALRLLDGWTEAQVPDRTRLIATAAVYAGYSLTLLGEGFCTATISTFDEGGNIVYGSEMSRADVLAQAEARFTRALDAATAAGDVPLRNLARLGRARVRLDLGRYADARADAAAVPAGFLYTVTASTADPRRQNRVWAESNPLGTSTSVGVPYRTLGDPRVPVQDRATTSPTGIRNWMQLKYPTATTPLPLATYEEALLIMAEADARAGALGPAQDVIATMRTRGGQPAFTGTTQAQVLAEIVDQRRRELFLESHHLGDLIRFGIAPSPAAGTAYHGGGTYGTQLCIPMPNVERLNNPNID